MSGCHWFNCFVRKLEILKISEGTMRLRYYDLNTLIYLLLVLSVKIKKKKLFFSLALSLNHFKIHFTPHESGGFVHASLLIIDLKKKNQRKKITQQERKMNRRIKRTVYD